MAKRKPKILSQPANKRTPDRMRRFLEIYATTGQVTAAAAAAGITRELHYHKLKTDRVYREAFQRAEEEAAQALEDEAVRRAYVGVQRPVMYAGRPVKQGKRILYHTTYSDTLLIALLRRFSPHLYGDQAVTEHTGSVDIVERLQAGRQRLAEMRAAG